MNKRDGFRTGGGGGLGLGPIVEKTTSYTLGAADNGKTFIFNGTNLTATLPASVPSASWAVVILNINATVLSIDPGASNLNGLNTKTSIGYNQSSTFYSDGSAYFYGTTASAVALSSAKPANPFPYELHYDPAGSFGGNLVQSFDGRTGVVTLQAADIEGLFSAAGQMFLGTGSGTGTMALRGASYFLPSNPGGTTSTTRVMMGLGSTIAFTPTTSSRLFVAMTATLTNNTTGDGMQGRMVWGTGVAPSNGAALTGTDFGNSIFLANCLAVRFSGTWVGLITGLSVGTAYWIDVGAAATTGGTASMLNAGCLVLEV